MEFLDFSGESEDVKRLRAFYEAVARGDFTAARQYLDPNFEWVGPDAPGLWFAGIHRGPDAVFQDIIEPAYGRIAEFRVKMKRFFEVGDHILVLGRVTGRTKMTGRTLDSPVAHVWTLRQGKAVRCETYHDTNRWLEALGQAPPQSEKEKLAA